MNQQQIDKYLKDIDELGFEKTLTLDTHDVAKILSDKLLKKPDILKILKIGRNKLYDIIKSGEFIKPIPLPNTQIDLYSHNELQDWIQKQKEVRDKTTENK
ncbi:hypothetical protein N5U18_02305 [Aliarcobacter butzleri]|uniref:helix-turn-helix transcriptional regulator n=1 Tax=Aliarcobacter butzleri TaxID=28197 RepID=UPI0021B1CB5B|nr:hypothetical protein [Aliarcobacter butzleri]MCT7547308.1 hypothetical protein [Aliarcobacter butzleri]